MLIDCDTCTVRGQGCDDCVVTVLLGAPPGWGSEPTVVPLNRRRPGPGADERTAGAPGTARATGTTDARSAATPRGTAPSPITSGDTPEAPATGGDMGRMDTAADVCRPVVELDDVERKAVRALAEFGLVPPLRHQDATSRGDRHVS